MTSLTVRRLLIDMEAPLPRNWFGGDAFRSAMFNALSMSFPFGEQFFIDAVRHGFKALPTEKQERFQAEVQGFIGQEATHRRIHALFNAHLENQGLQDGWTPRSRARLEPLRNADPRHALGITAANEHFTAIFAEWLLQNHGLMDGCEPRLKTMWQWHSAEEAEHKSTAFDLYQALGGSHAWRITWFKRITTIFLGDLMRQTAINLRHEGQLWRWNTLRSAAGFLFGRRGLVRCTYKPWRAYLREDFHPNQQHSELSRRWLTDNGNLFSVVGTVAPTA